MQVNNNVQSPNFGMALRIKKGPEVVDSLEKLTKKDLKALSEAGKILGREGEPNATKHYHVLVDTDSNGKVVAKIDADKDPYFGPFKVDMGRRENYVGEYGNDSNIIMIRNTYDGGPFAAVARYEKQGEKPIYDAWSYVTVNEELGVSQLAKIAKILDTVAAKVEYNKAAKLAKEGEIKAEKAGMVSDLMKDYGI